MGASRLFVFPKTIPHPSQLGKKLSIFLIERSGLEPGCRRSSERPRDLSKRIPHEVAPRAERRFSFRLELTLSASVRAEPDIRSQA
jgi:hypothetical protein